MKKDNTRQQGHKIHKHKYSLLGLNKKSRDTMNLNRQNIKESNIISNDDISPIVQVAIMGRPNVGKSSLFNRLNQKNIAITSHISGSTRDINKRDLRLQRFDITIIDTGGLEVQAHKLKDFNAINNNSHLKQYKKDSNSNIHEQNNSNPQRQAIIAQNLRESISLHSYQIVAQSDILIYMVDGNGMANDEDIRIFRELSKKKPTLLVLNKVDNDKILLNSSEFMSFGVGFITISVAHNRGITKLLTSIENMIQELIDSKKIHIKRPMIKELDFIDYFDDEESIIEFDNSLDNVAHDCSDKHKILKSIVNEDSAYDIAVGIIGRPNVGKSSLLNALTNTNRSLVSDIAGTTIDPIDEKINYKGHNITFVDTAGIRRRSKIEGIEKYALDRTQKMLNQCDIALLVLDCSVDFVELDEKISSIANSNNLGIIVVFNKWDIRNKDFDSRMDVYKRKFKFLEYAPIVTTSSITKKHIRELKQKIVEVYTNFIFRIPTARLNNCIQNANKKHPIPSDHGKIVKIYYATQFDIKPPKIALIMNRPNALHFSYRRYIINTLRSEFNLNGVPILIESRSKKERSEDVSENA